MAKIAVQLERALQQRLEQGTPGGQITHVLASGESWNVADVICTCGPHDERFEERRNEVVVAMVLAGTFAYRSEAGHLVLTPGSLLLGNAGQCFECGHEHSAGDRCIAFRFSPALFESIAADTNVKPSQLPFRNAGVPPIREFAPLIAHACAGLASGTSLPWEELSLELAARVLRLEERVRSTGYDSPGAVSRVCELVRLIERSPDEPHTVAALARTAGLSPYHFLRTFRRVTGVTPHQFILRARLRDAALRLATGTGRVIDAALASGFGDLSNFNRTFSAEFGMAPRQFRRAIASTSMRHATRSS